jgi:SagB-type dehydrogenase family enzyme
VADLPIGLYRYLPLQHKLLPLREKADLAAEVATACYNQPFITGSAVVFMWTAVPMRTEWRYSIISHKMIAIDAGHVCQNLYLAAESIGAGACAIGKYHQERMDQFLGVTGETEFAIYAAAVGKR